MKRVSFQVPTQGQFSRAADTHPATQPNQPGMAAPCHTRPGTARRSGWAQNRLAGDQELLLDGQRRPVTGLTHIQQTVLELMAEGHHDEAIAYRAGITTITTTTVRRHIAAIHQPARRFQPVRRRRGRAE
jgi:hypothetical protein